MALAVVRTRIIICLLSILAVAPLAPLSGGAQSVAQPVLTSVTANTALPDSIVVEGHGFTPGGDVYIALYDQWGLILHETRWVAAGGGGAIREAFEIATESIYGPNGSQDPSQPDRRGLTTSELPSSASCPDTLMVRAFDQRANAWSNVLDVEADCGQ